MACDVFPEVSEGEVEGEVAIVDVMLCDLCGRDIGPGLHGSLEIRTLSDDRDSHTKEGSLDLCCVCLPRACTPDGEFKARIESELRPRNEGEVTAKSRKGK